jgi:hypothetical protein
MSFFRASASFGPRAGLRGARTRERLQCRGVVDGFNGDSARDDGPLLLGCLSVATECLKQYLMRSARALRSYHDLEEKTRGSDLVTHALVVEFLREAVAGEGEFERLLGEPAPEMDGR